MATIAPPRPVAKETPRDENGAQTTHNGSQRQESAKETSRHLNAARRLTRPSAEKKDAGTYRIQTTESRIQEQNMPSENTPPANIAYMAEGYTRVGSRTADGCLPVVEHK